MVEVEFYLYSPIGFMAWCISKNKENTFYFTDVGPNASLPTPFWVLIFPSKCARQVKNLAARTSKLYNYLFFPTKMVHASPACVVYASRLYLTILFEDNSLWISGLRSFTVLRMCYLQIWNYITILLSQFVASFSIAIKHFHIWSQRNEADTAFLSR